MNHRLQHHRDCNPERCNCALHTPAAKCGHCAWLEFADLYMKISIVGTMLAFSFGITALWYWLWRKFHG